MASAREIIDFILKRMLSGGSRAAGASNVVLGQVLGAKDDYAAEGYPKQFSPDHDHYYDVVFAPPGQHNARGSGDPNVKLGGTMQSVKEHNDALEKYVRMLPKNASPRDIRTAYELGKEEEKKLPAFWAESKTRPSGKFSVGSSAVTGIRITPDGHVEVKWKGPTKNNPTGWYTFGNFGNPYDASKAAVELMQLPSIGRAVMPRKVVEKMKNPPPGMGQWNNRYYNGSYAV